VSNAPGTTFKPSITFRELRPKAVTGHLVRARYASGDRWIAHWRDSSGHQHMRTLGRVWRGGGRPADGYLMRRGAQERLDDILAEARKTVPRTAAAARGVTFAQAAEEWLRYVEFDRKRRESTMRDYRKVVGNTLVPVFGELALRELTSEMIDAYRAHLVAEGRLSDRTINKYLLVVHAIFKRAQRHWGLTVNPAAGIERQPIRRSTEFRVLSPEQVQALARAAADEQDAALYTTAAFAGLRLGELRALRWRDVDFDLRVIHVRRAVAHREEDIPKSGRARAVPLTDQVARALDGLSRRDHFAGNDDLVFPSPAGDYLEDSALRRRYYKALGSAGIEHLRFHDLRHTFGTLAVQEFSLSDVKAYMGHADIATTMIYVHHVPQHDAADRLTARLARSSPASGVSRAIRGTGQSSERC
jgi:integrase